MDQSLTLIFTIDRNYLQHFTVTLTSTLENNDDLLLNVFVIHDMKNTAEIDKVALFFKKKYGIILQLLSIDSNKFNEFKITDHVSKSTYFRLLLADIIPPNICTALFIDSDIVVTSSLRYFTTLNFAEDNENILVFAGKDGSAEDVERLNRLGFETNKYFNAGVMFINLKAWRKNKVSHKLINMADKYKNELIYWDQDVLNMFFVNSWSEIPSGYNAVGITKLLSELPTIIHYTGSAKPWDYKSKHPYRNWYFKFLKLTPFKFYSPFFAALKKKLAILRR